MLDGLLLWAALLLPGCRALTGPAEASGPLGGTVTVTCAYEPELAAAEKYWCRGWSRLLCSVRVAAAGAEAGAGRLRLRDERARHAFVVTMRDLAAGDGDTYWCGVRLPGYDAMVPVVVTVLLAPHTAAPRVYTTWGDPLPPAATPPAHPPAPASTTAALNSSSSRAGVPTVTVLALMSPIMLLLSIIAGLRLRRASRGKSSAGRDTGRTGHKERRGRRDAAAAPPNLYGNMVWEHGSPRGHYENGPAMRQDVAKGGDVPSCGRKGPAAGAQPIYCNVPPAGRRSGPHGHQAPRAGRGAR